ncbi:hypothetical protein GF352_04605 [archaeon]|nr:hypothetical protein [archaeon]
MNQAMVFESILSPSEVREKSWKMFLMGLLSSSAGIALSLWVFPDNPSISVVFLTTMACIPILVNVLKMEGGEDFSKKEFPLIGNHKDVLGVVFFLFFGLLLSFTTWYLVLPPEIKARVFSSQINTINNINSGIQGGYIQTTYLKIILANNFKVLFFCLLFSLLYGAGAIFIIAWNASVLGTAIGNVITSNIQNALSYFHAIPIGFGQYLIHGVPEIIAYFMAGIAGGIISAAVIRYKPRSKKFKEVLLDSIDLIILASVTLIISGLIEVFISLGG